MKSSRNAAAILLLLFFAAAPRMAHPQSRQNSRRRTIAASPQEQALYDLLVQAKAAADKNDYATATADYEKYLTQKPDDAAAHFDLGYVYTAQKQRDKAVMEYRKAVVLDPKMAQAYLNLGISLLEDNPKGAIAPLRKATELNYDYAQGHYLLGTAEERAGQPTDAVKEYTIAVKLDPNDYSSHFALARVELAAGNAIAAEPEFREALKLKANNAEAELGLAQSLIEQKKSADAAAALNDYLRESPEDAKARVTRESLITELGKKD